MRADRCIRLQSVAHRAGAMAAAPWRAEGVRPLGASHHGPALRYALAQHRGADMADTRTGAMTKAGLGAAVLIALVSIIFCGRAIEDVAEAAAQCMEERHSLHDCDHPEPVIFWE